VDILWNLRVNRGEFGEKNSGITPLFGINYLYLWITPEKLWTTGEKE
jgi:hypothetical protein